MKRFLVLLVIVIGVFLIHSRVYAAALTAGATYTIEVDAIGSDGNIVDLGLSTTAIADSDGKVFFSLSGVPTQSQYNFLLVTIKDSVGTTVRRSIAPAAPVGGTTNLGASPMTEAQTNAMLSAMSTAGTDDPIMVLFGFIIIRSGGFGSSDITHLANIGRLAIRNGFNVYLEAKIGAAKMAAFRTAIVTRLGNYSSNLKDSVDATDATTSKNERAEAASLLSQILIEAAAEADFDVGYINAAMKAASDQAEEYLLGDGANMDEAAVSAMDKVMMANYMKLSAERVRKRYTTALTTLDATEAQVTRLNNAITTLSNSLLTAFQEMEEVFQDEESLGSKDDIDSKYNTVETQINSAFTQFMTDSASTNAEIDDMVTAMANGFNIDIATLNNMKDPNSDGNYGDGMFAFREMGGTTFNWPITMVVPVTWVANNYPTTFTYTQDTLGIPQAMWFSQRTDFQGGYGMPAALAALFALREDIEIINGRKWAGLAAASKDMTEAGYTKLAAYPADQALADSQIDAGTLTIIDTEDSAAADDEAGATLDSFQPLGDLNPWLTGFETQGLEDLYIQRLMARQSAIGPDTITDAQKQALLETATMPDFH